MRETMEIVAQAEAPASIEAVSRAEIDVQIRTARTYQRKELSILKQRMLSHATIDEETAASCFYKIPRGSDMIEGPSVRLAEIVAANYGNLRVATRTLETVTTGDSPHVVVQVAIHDLENNLAVQVEKRRRITGKKSKGGRPDEDDINLATNACASVAFRDAVFRVVPNVLVHPVLEACKRVAVGKATSLSGKRIAILKRLAQLGAPQARVLASLGVKKVEDITLEHCEDLIGRGTALKDGGMVENVFPVEETAPQAAPATQQAQTPQPTTLPTPATAPIAEQGNSNQTEPKVGDGPIVLQDELANILTENGYTFDDFIKWARESGNLTTPQLDCLTGFADVPDDVCRRLNRSRVGLLEGLRRITAS
jgi:hypothetical protein